MKGTAPGAEASHAIVTGDAAFEGLRWRCCRFDALTVFELQNIYAARQQVFAIEQNCVYLDVDGDDEAAYHLAAWAPDHRLPWGYARLLDPATRYDEASIGRVLTTAPARGRGLGRALVRRAIAVCDAAWPSAGIRISAQARRERFYAAEGFVAVGTPYDEDGIPHVAMLRAPVSPAASG